MTDKKLTDKEIAKSLKEILEILCVMGDLQKASTISKSIDLINRLQAENERLQEEGAKEFTCFVGDPHKVEHCPYLEELQTARTKALKEAASKFAGHSDYHGDTILCKLHCMAEGKEVENAKPLDTSNIKIEAYKEFAYELMQIPDITVYKHEIKNLLKEKVGENDAD